jgi:uncharacterized protein (UPF0218 family)
LNSFQLSNTELRKKLATPFGIILKGSPNETMQELIKYIKNHNPKKIIVVGDVVAANALRHGIFVNIFVVDNKTMRREIEPALIYAKTHMNAKNPRSTITHEAWAVLARAVKENQTVKISIEGEEDLLVLPAVLAAPIGSLVVYGQPNEGIVLVNVTRSKKREAALIIESMEG